MTATQGTAQCDQRQKGCIDQNDATGTKPNRNNYDQVSYTSYKQDFILVPDNHTAPEERLLHPNKGELNN